jgi:uncharacterized membrane protein
MGMQNFFMAIYDQPDAVHQLMAYLRDNALRRMYWMEAEGLLISTMVIRTALAPVTISLVLPFFVVMEKMRHN